MCEFFLDVIVPVVVTVVLGIGVMFLWDEVQNVRKGYRKW